MSSAVDLTAFDCSSCSARQRKQRGCHGGASIYRFPEPNDRCPRRHWLEHPEIREWHRLYRATEGRLGTAGLSLTSWDWEAMDVVESAVNWRAEQEADLAKKQAERRGR